MEQDPKLKQPIDFVIDTGMPVTPPVQEEPDVEPKTSEPSPVEADESVAGETAVEPEAEETSENEGNEIPNHENSQPEEEPDGNFWQESEETSQPESEGPTLADIAILIEGLQKKFDEKIAVDEHKNGLFDKLYKERDEYKNDLYGKLLKPFITGCMEIINDLKMYISKMDNYDVQRSLDYLRSLPDDLEELLKENGVELYSDESETFNPRTQRAKKIVPTEDPALNNIVAERLDKGYRWNGAILRPEMVAVYKIKQ